MESFFEIIIVIGGLTGLVVGLIQLYKWFAEPISNWYQLRRQRRKYKKYVRLENRIKRVEKEGSITSIIFESLSKLMMNVAIIGIGLMSINIHSDFNLANQTWVPKLMTWPFDATNPTVNSLFLALGIFTILLGGLNLFLSGVKLDIYSYSIRNLKILKLELEEMKNDLSKEELKSLNMGERK